MTLKIELHEDSHGIMTDFISARVALANAKGVTVGLSGGVDSSLVAKLSMDALGKENVLGIMMPSADSPRSDLEDATTLADWLGIRTELVPIGPMVEGFVDALGPDKRELGNIRARCRMIISYQRAMTNGYLVAGTGNKSELLVGYFTKYGDGGVDLLPIGDIYKTQVRLLSEELGIPRPILEKAPSAGLWKGQTDEGELGITYEKLDQILRGIELGLSQEDIERRTGFSHEDVMRIENMVEISLHKRKIPPVPKVGTRTLGIDWRE